MLARLIMGEKEYHGKWKTLTMEELEVWKEEELLDYFIYGMFQEELARSVPVMTNNCQCGGDCDCKS